MGDFDQRLERDAREGSGMQYMLFAPYFGVMICICEFLGWRCSAF